jgi:ribose transport system substrate-binding protein
VESYKRHPIILDLLRQMGEVTVEDLARRLNVSENTIRNDLNALEARELLIRVRGGAIPADTIVRTDSGSRPFAARTTVLHAEKQRIGAWAAQLVSDSDAVVLDASSTAYQLATFLSGRNHLTVLTNGLHVALLLAQNPTNHVILASNTISHDGFSTIGALNPEISRNFRASKAFVSCTGLTLDWGLAEVAIEEATLKAQMIELASEVIALVDHSKFGRIETYRSIPLDYLHRLVTDDAISRDALERMRREFTFPITVVGSGDAHVYLPAPPPALRIGFGNLSERMPFARQVRHSLQTAAAKHSNIELLIRDNDLSRELALSNADWFVEQGVDVLLEYQIDYEAGNVMMDKFHRAGIPVIAVDIGMPGATFFGADNYRAGYMAGEYLGQWVREQWDLRFDILLRLEAERVGTASRARLQGAQDGFESVAGRVPGDRIRSLSSQTLIEESRAVTTEALASYDPDWRVAVIAVNDEAAVGALDAFEAAGRLHNVVAVGQNADEIGRAALQREGFPFVATTRYGPEDYGPKLLDLALKLCGHQRVPPAVYVDHMLVHRENVHLLDLPAPIVERG